MNSSSITADLARAHRDDLVAAADARRLARSMKPAGTPRRLNIPRLRLRVRLVARPA